MYESIRLWAISAWASVIIAYAMWKEALGELFGDNDDNWPHGGAA